MKNFSLFLIFCLSFVLTVSSVASEMIAQFESPPVQIAQTNDLELTLPENDFISNCVDQDIGILETQEVGNLQNDKFIGHTTAEKCILYASFKLRCNQYSINRTLKNQTYHGSGGLIG